MQPSRVQVVHYRIVHAAGESYRNKHAEGRLGDFVYVLDDALASFFPDADFSSIEAALAVLEPLVLAWNISALLTLGPGAFELTYCDESDSASPDGTAACASHSPALILHDAYPAPQRMAANACVIELADAYADMLRAPENVVRGGRTCLAALERWYGGRALAAAKLNVDLTVLNRLSAITREWGRDSPEKPRFSTWRASRWINRHERAWLIEVTREVTRRAAQEAAGQVPDETFTRLPR